MKARERQLREMIVATEKRMNRADISDNDFVRLGRMRRDLLADLDEMKANGSASTTQRTGLSEFEKKMKERERQRAAASGG